MTKRINFQHRKSYPANGNFGVYGIDCEMCYTIAGLQLTKVPFSRISKKIRDILLKMYTGDCGGGGWSAGVRVPGFARLPGRRLQHKVFGHHPERPW